MYVTLINMHAVYVYKYEVMTNLLFLKLLSVITQYQIYVEIVDNVLKNANV